MDEDATRWLSLVSADCLCQCCTAFLQCLAASTGNGGAGTPACQQALLLVPVKSVIQEQQQEPGQAASAYSVVSTVGCNSSSSSTTTTTTRSISISGDGARARDWTGTCTACYPEIGLTGVAHEVRASGLVQRHSVCQLHEEKDPLAAHVPIGSNNVSCRLVPVELTQTSDTMPPAIVVAEVYSCSVHELRGSESSRTAATAAAYKILGSIVSKIIRSQELEDEARLWRLLQSVNDAAEEERLSTLCSACACISNASAAALCVKQPGVSGREHVLCRTPTTSAADKSDHVAHALDNLTLEERSEQFGMATVGGPLMATGKLCVRLVRADSSGCFPIRRLNSTCRLLHEGAAAVKPCVESGGRSAPTPRTSTAQALFDTGKHLLIGHDAADRDSDAHGGGSGGGSGGGGGTAADVCQRLVDSARLQTASDRVMLYRIETDKATDCNVLVRHRIAPCSDTATATDKHPKLPMDRGITATTALRGQLLNITDVARCSDYCHEVDDAIASQCTPTGSVLSLPVYGETRAAGTASREQSVIGVLQLCRSNGDLYTKVDEETACMFALYCGLAFAQQSLYMNLVDAENRSNLLTELMVFHMQVPESEMSTVAEVKSLSMHKLEEKYQLSRHTFTGLSLDEQQGVQVVIGMFNEMGMSNRWKIAQDKLARFVLTIRRGYRDPPYHNWNHALSVTHFCFYLWKKNQLKYLSDIEKLALFVACLCHDIDHRGTNNTFQVAAGSALASLYMDHGSVMERHHFAQTMCILSDRRCNIFSELTSSELQTVTDLVYDIILDTDLSRHITVRRAAIMDMVEGDIEPDNREHHTLLLSLLMSASDLNSSAKSWLDAQLFAERLYAEFFNQGELERALAMSPGMMMDREAACIPDEQIKFMSGIAEPIFVALHKVYPETAEVLEQMKENLDNWKRVKHEFWKQASGTVSPEEAPTPTPCDHSNASPTRAPSVSDDTRDEVSTPSSCQDTQSTSSDSNAPSDRRRRRKHASTERPKPGVVPGTVQQDPRQQRHSYAGMPTKRPKSSSKPGYKSLSVAGHAYDIAGEFIMDRNGLRVLPSCTSRRDSLGVGIHDVHRMVDSQAPIGVSSPTPLPLGRCRPSEVAPTQPPLYHLSDNTEFRRTLLQRLEQLTGPTVIEQSSDSALDGHRSRVGTSVSTDGASMMGDGHPDHPASESMSPRSSSSSTDSQVRSSISSYGEPEAAVGVALAYTPGQPADKRNSSSSEHSNGSQSSAAHGVPNQHRRRKLGSTERRLLIDLGPTPILSANGTSQSHQLQYKRIGVMASDPGPAPNIAPLSHRPSEPART